MEEITKSEIAFGMLGLLLVLLITIVSHWIVGIIGFAILYHAFMYSRRPIIISSNSGEIKEE